MYFSKNELIELNDGTKYLILDTLILDDISYYKVEKIKDNTHTNDILFITASNNEGKLYINKKIDSTILSKLEEICA